MLKVLNTYKRQPVTQDDESIIIKVVITETDDGMSFALFRQDASIKTGNNVTEVSEETLSINDIDVGQLVAIYELLVDWLDSNSKSTFFEDVPDVEGGYEREDKQPSYRGGSKTSNHTFNDLKLSVGEFSIGFQFRSNGETKGLRIPSSKEVNRGVPQDFRNVYQLTQAIFDFFTLRYSGDVAGFDLDEPDKIGQDAVERIEHLFDRFDIITRQLQKRGRDRTPLTIQDEYDLQYLFHAILRIDFDDIRDETYLKQHAGVSPRIDFLIEEEGIGIETKLASEENTMKKIRRQLAEDKEHYKSDSICNTLLCLIYDPERVLTNPAEIEKDLSEVNENLTTRVTVTQ